MDLTSDKPTARVSRFTIGRLYNLGSYEHIRYELSIDVPEGASAKEAFDHAMSILGRLNPKPPVDSYALGTATRVLASPAADLSEWEAQELTKYREVVAKYDAWKAEKDAVSKELDAIGVTRVYKDAKEEWDQEDR